MNAGQKYADRLVEIWAEPGKVGTGITVGLRGILTAGHVIQSASNLADGIRVRIVPTGTMVTRKPVWVHADCVYSAPDWDVALLEVRDQPGWVAPETATPVLVALDSRPESGCHCVGFAEFDVQQSAAGKPLRQTTAVVGKLLPAGQARVQPEIPGDLPLPRRWMIFDIDTTPPLEQDEWGGMSGAPVELPHPDGRLAALVLGASPRTSQLLVVALNDVVNHADGFREEFVRLSGSVTAAEVRDAPRYRAALTSNDLNEDGRPRRVDEQNSLVAFGVKHAVTEEPGGFLDYVGRDSDGPATTADGRHVPGLREVLREVKRSAAEGGAGRRVVLIEGSAAAGKSRSAAEAAIAELGGRWLLRPIRGDARALRLILDWPAEELRQGLIWLDDVEQYAEPGIGETLRRLLAAGAVVVATIRTAQLKEMTDTGNLQNSAGLALNDPSLVVQLHWKKEWSATERAAAQDILENQQAIEAVSGGMPLGVWAIAGGQLLEKYDRIPRDDDHPEQMAVLRASLDWYRTGHARGIPRAVLVDVLRDAENNRPYGGTGAFRPTEIEAAIDELARPVFGRRDEGNALILLEDDGDSLRVHDYIRDADALTTSQIPRAIWLAAVKHASDRGAVYNVSVAASQADVFDETPPLLEELLQQTMDEIDAIASQGGIARGVPTGFRELDELTNGLGPGQLIVVAARPGMGKALALDTPLPTPAGWTTMGSIDVGDVLIDPAGQATRVVAATDVMLARPCFEIEFSDGTVIVADAEHEWPTRSGVRKTSELRCGVDVVVASGAIAQCAQPPGTSGVTTPMVHIDAVRRVCSVPVRCVQVDNPSHLYLAGRGMVPTHNSTLCLDFVRACSIRFQLPSVIFALDMSESEIVMRLLSAEAKIKLADMRSGRMSDDDWTRLARRMAEVSEAPLYIDSSARLTMVEIVAKARRLRQNADLRLIVVDYLQLMASGNRFESPQQQMSEICRELKLLAVELGIAVVAVSQLSLASAYDTDTPARADLRESGIIEHECDLVILLHRPDAFDLYDIRSGEADLIVARHRNGPTRTITVAHQLHISRFANLGH